jgi:hypothetical protein
MRAPRIAGLLVLATLALCALGAPTALAAGPPEAPTTEAASSVLGTSATFNGVLNPKSEATVSWYFAYNAGASCSGGSATPTEGPVTVKDHKVLFHATGLAPSTSYAVCLVASVEPEEGVVEATVGSQVTFKTGRSAPLIDAESTGAVTPFEATIEAQVNPEREDTSCSVEYGTTITYGTSVACEPADLGGSFGDEATVTHLTELTPGAAYFYRVVATNATGTTKGTGGKFTAPSLEAPTVESESVSRTTPVEAVVEAQIDPDYQATTFHFEYATNSAFNEAVTGGGGTLSGGPGQSTGPVVLANTLKPGQLYFYRVVAENATGPKIGDTEHFTTIGLPSVQTGAAQVAGETTAALSGTIDPEGAETTYRFLYITQVGYEAALNEGAAGPGENPYRNGVSTAAFSLPAGLVSDDVGPVAASELKPGTTYVYALAATNEAGTELGAPETFTTAPAAPAVAGETPATTPPAPAYTPSAGAVFSSLAGVQPISSKISPPVTKSVALTRSQRLARALKACRKKSKRSRGKCERQARKTYGATKKR